MGRTLCVGDIHGNFKGFKQALERCNFDYDNDTLISLGDVVDGHSQSYEVVEELLKIRNLIPIRGNHDDWWLSWIQRGVHPSLWMQGSQATAESYLKHVDSQDFHLYDYSTGIARPRITTNHLPDSHINFFDNQISYHIDNQNRLFVHGGFNRHFSLEDPIHNDEDVLMWDRDLWSQALSYGTISAVEGIEKPKFKMVGDFKEVFIGHTSTQFWKENKPMNAANIWNLDTGGGWYGFISIMDVDTKEVWQSDSGKELYPEFKGR